MNKQSSRVLTSLFFAWIFIFQNVAFAMKPNEVSKASSRAQLEMNRVKEKVGQRFNKLSDKRKVKLLKRTKRRLTRAQSKLENTNNLFIEKTITSSNNTTSSEEKELFEGLAPKTDTVTIKIDKFEMLRSADKSLDVINEAIETLTYKLANVDSKNSRSIASDIWSDLLIDMIIIALCIIGAIFPIFGAILGVIAIAIFVILVVAFISVVSVMHGSKSIQN